MTQLVLQLSDDLARALDDASRAAHRPPEDIAREMVEKALAVRRIDAVREEIQRSLGDDAPETDEEVFKQIS
jgi:hypothetical protein